MSVKFSLFPFRKNSSKGQASFEKKSSRVKQNGHSFKQSKAAAGGTIYSEVNALKRFNIALLLFWCLVMVIMVLFLMGINKIGKADWKPAAIPGHSRVDADVEKREFKPLSYYLDIIGKRNLFKLLAVKPKIEKPAVLRPEPSELLKDYTLMGIISGENPQAIIEDRKTKNTYFLNKGQNLGEMLIVDIQEDKVVLEVDGQQLDLNL